MSTLNDCDVDYIVNDLKNKGITDEDLLWEITDHICCLLEPEFESGAHFSDAYEKMLQSLDNNTFREIQHQTNLLTNLKLQTMKKTMFVLGSLGTLFLFTGIIFKVNHFPGAAVSILLGTLIIVLGFLPLFFIVAYKEQRDDKSLLLSLAGYFTIALLIVGPLFKIMHWPFANKLLFFGPLLLAVFFMPLYLIKVFRKANETKTNFVYMLIIVGIGVSSLLMLSTTRISKDVLDHYEVQYREYKQEAELFAQKNTTLLKELSKRDSLESREQILGELNYYTKEISKQINLITKELLTETDNPDTQIEDLGNKDDWRAFDAVMSRQNNGENLQKLLSSYRAYLLSLTDDAYLQGIVNEYFEFYLFNPKEKFVRYDQIVTMEALSLLEQAERNTAMATFQLLREM